MMAPRSHAKMILHATITRAAALSHDLIAVLCLFTFDVTIALCLVADAMR